MESESWDWERISIQRVRARVIPQYLRFESKSMAIYRKHVHTLSFVYVLCMAVPIHVLRLRELIVLQSDVKIM